MRTIYDNTLPGFDFKNRTYNCRGKDIKLTHIEIEILAFLTRNKGKILTTKEIYEKVWDEPFMESANNTVMVHIKNLRKKLEIDPKEPTLIITAWGKGYSIQ